MALDRTWYNTLIDDDGSNTVGSVWNKASVDALMDAIDAQLAGIEKGTWTPTLVASGGGTPSYTTNVGVWSRAGKAVIFGGHTLLSSKGSMIGGLQINGFPFAWSGDQGLGTVNYFGGLTTGVYGVTLYGVGGSSIMYLAASTGTGASSQLQVSQLGASNVDLWYQGSVTVL